MAKKELKIFVLSISVFILSAYTFASSGNLFKNGHFILDKIPADRIRIFSVSAFLDKDMIRISGRIKKADTAYIKSGHVDMVIISPEGEVLEEVSTCYIPRSLNLRKRHTHGSRFYAEIPLDPPKGSIVRVAFHKESVKTESFACNDNIALPER